jgi:hypothetical protein
MVLNCYVSQVLEQGYPLHHLARLVMHAVDAPVELPAFCVVFSLLVRSDAESRSGSVCEPICTSVEAPADGSLFSLSSGLA